MISHSHRFIYIHIPKTAGTTITRTIGGYGIMLGGERNSRSIYFKHADAEYLSGTLGDEFDRYYRFGFVRNPWDWCVSNYEFNRGMHKPYRVGTEYDLPNYRKGKGYIVPDEIQALEFEQWLDWWLDRLAPQMLGMLTDANGRLLVDAVYRFENLEADFRALISRLGIEVPPELPHINRNRSRQLKYSEYYDSATRARVASYFHREIDEFGYRFEE